MGVFLLHWANGQVVQKSGNASVIDSNNTSVLALNLWVTATMLVYLLVLACLIFCVVSSVGNLNSWLCKLKIVLFLFAKKFLLTAIVKKDVFKRFSKINIEQS